MAKLSEIASLIRSKNAGPFVLTFDIFFSETNSYTRVKNSGVLSKRMFAGLYDCSEDSVQFFECDNALAFKFSIPRPVIQGEPEDGDLHGGQQHAPLMEVEVP